MKDGTRTEGLVKSSGPNTPLISIVTVVLNGESLLEETIKSVLSQNYKNFEYIIIDGASRDGTLDIIKKYGASIDYWISEPDQGVYEAMNKGIRAARGVCVGLLNCGDFYNPNTLDVVRKYTDGLQDKYFVITGGMVKLDEVGHETYVIVRDEAILEKRFVLMPINHPATFISSSVYSDFGVYDIKYKISADYDFVLKLLDSNIKVTFVPDILTRMRAGGISDAPKTFPVRLKECFNIRKKYKGRFYSMMVSVREILSFLKHSSRRTV